MHLHPVEHVVISVRVLSFCFRDLESVKSSNQLEPGRPSICKLELHDADYFSTGTKDTTKTITHTNTPLNIGTYWQLV